MCPHNARRPANPPPSVLRNGATPAAGPPLSRNRSATHPRGPHPASASVGGRPVRSKPTRRSRRARSASGEGCRSSFSRRARIKVSIGFRTQRLFRTAGSAGRTGGLKLQWPSHLAPCPIQSRRVATSRSPPEGLAVGIRRRHPACRNLGSHSLQDPRSPAPSPGTTTGGREPLWLFTPSSMSSRAAPPGDWLRSGPWQEKHRSDRIGRTSRAKSTGGAAESCRASIAPGSSPGSSLLKHMAVLVKLISIPDFRIWRGWDSQRGGPDATDWTIQVRGAMQGGCAFGYAVGLDCWAFRYKMSGIARGTAHSRAPRRRRLCEPQIDGGSFSVR